MNLTEFRLVHNQKENSFKKFLQIPLNLKEIKKNLRVLKDGLELLVKGEIFFHIFSSILKTVFFCESPFWRLQIVKCFTSLIEMQGIYVLNSYYFLSLNQRVSLVSVQKRMQNQFFNFCYFNFLSYRRFCTQNFY